MSCQLEVLSWQTVGTVCILTESCSPWGAYCTGFTWCAPTGLTQHIHQLVVLNVCVSPSFIRVMVVQEYYACFPSPTPFGLGLGSD